MSNEWIDGPKGRVVGCAVALFIVFGVMQNIAALGWYDSSNPVQVRALIAAYLVIGIVSCAIRPPLTLISAVTVLVYGCLAALAASLIFGIYGFIQTGHPQSYAEQAFHISAAVVVASVFLCDLTNRWWIDFTDGPVNSRTRARAINSRRLNIWIGLIGTMASVLGLWFELRPL